MVVLSHSSTRYVWIQMYAALLSLLTLTGCNVYDPIIKEMDRAYASGERTADVTKVVQKHFPQGMKMEDAVNQLHLLKEQGFSIGEYHHDRARQWPDGEFKPYLSPSLHDRRRLHEGIVEFFARKKYDRKYLIVEKQAVIRVTTNGHIVLESSGAINITGI